MFNAKTKYTVLSKCKTDIGSASNATCILRRGFCTSVLFMNFSSYVVCVEFYTRTRGHLSYSTVHIDVSV